MWEGLAFDMPIRRRRCFEVKDQLIRKKTTFDGFNLLCYHCLETSMCLICPVMGKEMSCVLLGTWPANELEWADSEKSCQHFFLVGRILSVSSSLGIGEIQGQRKNVWGTGSAGMSWDWNRAKSLSKGTKIWLYMPLSNEAKCRQSH